MVREYLKQNVYDALLERLDFIFREFDNIYISFSGGKDSGLLLNLLLDFRDKHYPDRPIGVFHQDFEAQYTVTIEYIERTFERIKDRVEPYWVCLPMATRTAVGNYEMYWYPWDDKKEESWVRPMPDKEYVINTRSAATGCPTIPETKNPVSYLWERFRTIRTTSDPPRIFPAGNGCATAS